MTAATVEWTPTKVGYVRAVVDGASRLGTRNGEPGPLSDYWRMVLTDLLDSAESRNELESWKATVDVLECAIEEAHEALVEGKPEAALAVLGDVLHPEEAS